MLEIMQFIFSSLWVWAGTVVLLSIVTQEAYSLMGPVLSVLRGRSS